MNRKRRIYRFLRWGSYFCILLATAISTFGSGTVTVLTQQNLEEALSGGGTVLFGVGGILRLTNTITISQSTIISANGYEVTISGSNTVRLFIVATNVGFQVNGLTMADGWVKGTNGLNGLLDPPPTYGTSGESVFGAGIWNQGGTLTLLNCTLTNHHAIGGNSGTNFGFPNSGSPPLMYGGNALGGGIYSIGGAVNLTNCILAGNTVAGGLASVNNFYHASDAGGAFGGALYLQGTGYCYNVTFLGNNATGGMVVASSGIGYGGHALGGALFATNSTVFMYFSSATSNTAAGGGVLGLVPRASSSFGSGRGMGGTLFFSQDCSACIRHFSASGNTAVGGIGSRYHPGGGGLGGVIFNAGTLQVSDSTFSLSQCIGGAGSLFPGVGLGGAIYSTNDLRIDGCTFDHNSAIGAPASGESPSAAAGAQGAGGGVWSASGFAMTNSTFTGNSAKGGNGGGNVGGPGPAADGAGGAVAVTNGTAYLINITVAGNRADGGSYPGTGPARGGEIYSTNSSVASQNSIFATSASGGDVWGTLVDWGYNICSDGSANFSAIGSLNNTDPLLAGLANYGGPTATMALLIGSPALNAVPSGYPPTDQRGVSRPQGAAGDIGAFESTSALIPSPELTAMRVGTNITISFTAMGGLSYRLLHSTNLTSWSSVDTNTRPTVGPLQFLQPTGFRPTGYYQVVTP